MRADHKSATWGIILIIVGIGLLGNNIGWFSFEWDQIWPWLLVGFGLLFWIQWAGQRERYGLLMPGTIFLTYGFLFLYEVYTQWDTMDNLWPFFILGPGLGFIAMYFAGKREKGLLISGGILTLLAVFYLFGLDRWDMLWPLVLIGIGIYLILKGRRHFAKKNPAEPDSDGQ